MHILIQNYGLFFENTKKKHQNIFEIFFLFSYHDWEKDKNFNNKSSQNKNQRASRNRDRERENYRDRHTVERDRNVYKSGENNKYFNNNFFFKLKTK